MEELMRYKRISRPHPLQTGAIGLEALKTYFLIATVSNGCEWGFEDWEGLKHIGT